MSELNAIYGRRWTGGNRAEMRELWAVLVEDFFQQFIDPQGTVLDIGAGYCEFINAVKAARRIAIDANPSLREHAAANVEPVVTSDLSLPTIPDATVSNVFMSNFLEHLGGSDDVLALLRTVHRKLADDGSLLVLQPNFSLIGAAYFDFIDHRVVLTDKSLVEALDVTGFRVTHLVKRFLPYTSKSSLPRSASLARLYLRMRPLWWLFGKQTFVVAHKRSAKDEGDR
jgi:SAM-dependent methyltransferase